MNYETAKTLAEEINRQPIMKQYLTPAKNHKGNDGYCCIFCGSGTHENATGAMKDYGDHVYCHVCRKTGYNTDLIAAHLGCTPTGADFFRVVEYGCNELGIAYIEPNENNISTSIVKNKNEGAAAKMEQQPKKDYSSFYQNAQSRLADFISKQGGSWRGLSLEDLQAARAGFNKFDDGECIILPYDKNTYFRRSISDTPKIKMKNSGGKVQIYNPYDVLHCGKLIFAVEGEIDCISIHKCGCPSLALGGISQIDKFLNQLENEFNGAADKPKFIVLFDNNDEGAGQKAATELISKLLAKGYKAVNFILSPNLKYDANEFLQKNSEAFSARLAEIYKSAEKEFAALENETFGTRLDFFFQHKYFDSTARNRRFEDLQTGFTNLDEMQEFESGIYTIGAPPSLGKTSFVWQLLEQTARQSYSMAKIHCIFVSYEMSEEVLFSKSMARGVFEYNKANNEDFEPTESLTSARIRKGIPFVEGYQDDCLEVLEKLQRDDIDLRILDLTTAPLEIDDLIKRLETIAAALSADDILIFAIDYLQRIPNSKQDNAKGAVDYAMLELKKFVQKTNSICFLISSYNRVSYRTETGFEAFKESGSIEYSSDVMFALQLYCRDENNKPSTTQSDFDIAKGKQPRPMILKCLKNRFGNDYKIYFEYYSAVDCFIPCTESDLQRL